MNLRARLSLFFVALLGATLLASYAINARAMHGHLLDEFVNRTQTLAEGVAAAAGYGLLTRDLLVLDNLVSRTAAAGLDVRYVAVADPLMRVVVHSEEMRAGSSLPKATARILRQVPGGSAVYEVPGDVGGVLEVRSPVRFQDRELGTVVVGIDRSSLVKAQREAGRAMLAAFLAVLLLGVSGIFALAEHLARPIRALSHKVEELRWGAAPRPRALVAPDELGRLSSGFDELSTLISEQRDAIGVHGRALEGAYVATVRVLAAAIEARDPYTHGHSSRVAEVSRAIGRRLGLLQEELDELVVACLFHDVGKIRTPDAILRKHGRLTTAETREMMRHPHHGAEILSHAVFLLKYVPSVLHHHERHDGTGYPDGLRQDRIPLTAAIISLADAYDAMTSDRPYRRALSDREAKAELVKHSGTQFRPLLVDAFLAEAG